MSGPTLKIGLSSFAAGLIFALGLGLSGMTQPGKVINFLDVAGDWDPSLAFVMIGSIAVYAVGFRLLTQRAAPVLVGAWSLPTRRDLTPRLFIGAALFGLGWGLAGFCPGPAIVSVVSGTAPALVFVAAMVVGMRAEAIVSAFQAKESEPAATPSAASAQS